MIGFGECGRSRLKTFVVAGEQKSLNTMDSTLKQELAHVDLGLLTRWGGVF